MWSTVEIGGEGGRKAQSRGESKITTRFLVNNLGTRGHTNSVGLETGKVEKADRIGYSVNVFRSPIQRVSSLGRSNSPHPKNPVGRKKSWRRPPVRLFVMKCFAVKVRERRNIPARKEKNRGRGGGRGLYRSNWKESPNYGVRPFQANQWSPQEGGLPSK